ncbi:carbohydrate-binding protein [Flavobacterium nackdongense]|uniref:glucan endo-1,3-beta-D-glucosidase n=1 Tax=Flavobacterium nackdongense TaxID=2547394 RepID=A0A4P6YI41_9FLAO|nr:carbohydrate-binding protein [Flavobacterium nackdongense]
MIFLFATAVVCFLCALDSSAQVIPVGSGSYTKTFPGTDAAGRNGFPSGTPNLSGAALGKPVPTNDWWSKLAKETQASNLFTYPYTLKTTPNGLVVSYIPSGVIDDMSPVVMSVVGMAATKTTVSDYSDWTVTMDWNDGTRNFQATAGIAMPFLYFTKKTTDVVQVTVNSGTVTISNEMLVIVNAKNSADFAVYAPTGSTWTQNGGVYTSTLNGKNYWSMAFIPLTASNVTTVANEYKKYAYVFPTSTTSSFNYNESTSVMRTDFNVITEVKEGTESNVLLGLLPHQWDNLAANSPVPNKYSYATIRGEMKTLDGNSFSVENKFHGILPTLPYVDNYSDGFTPTALTEKIASIENDALATWTDSYNEGQVMNRLIQTARIADEMGNIAARDKMLATVKERLEDWLKAEGGEVAFLFYYNTTWSAMLGYPAGHGQDTNINDHHFHWGYFIHAASFLEQYQPGWAAQYGEMINLLIRDAASTDRNDALFPYLRNFSPYAGHCWANGFATFPQGNDQESTSESMQFNSSLIHWGEVTGNKAIRDLGIYLYTTEQTAIDEYWLDTKERNFPPSQQYSLVSRVWGNSFDNGTFWTADIAASYGIELYPIHGGSLYLGQDTAYVTKLWNEIEANTGILTNQVNANLWHDVMWEYLAFINPAKAISLYNSYPNRELKFGVSDAQTYHWLHAMNALGRVDATITANSPIAAAFTQNGKTNYVAHNYTDQPITVTFSTGYQLAVPARKMVSSMDSKVTGVITTTFQQAFVNGSVKLDVVASGGTPIKVEFMDGTTSLGIATAAPYTWNATNLTLGVHSFYAKVYEDTVKLNVTNSVDVIVGNQMPYGGTAWGIPGVIEAGKFDTFEGGKGQNIAYLDGTTANLGDFRMDEAVDAISNVAEGATVGHIASGEWLEYTVNVAQSGLYSFDFRYASGNAAGGGPFHLELDGKAISTAITVPSSSTTSWDVWATKTVSNIPLTPGEHILRVVFASGEFNLAKMTFARTGDLTYSYPTANAGPNLKVILPLTTTAIDGSASTESEAKPLTYLWTQNYGPSAVQFSDATAVNPTINGLVEGTYSLKLTVTNPDLRTDSDELLILVTNTANALPTVSLVTPADNATFTEGKAVSITANASDFDGTIQQVDFYQGSTLISSDTSAPYAATWNPSAGTYALTAKATDNNGAISTSQIVNVTIAAAMVCVETSKLAQQGTFSIGYKSTFETVGTNVYVTFELLDTDKTGVIAYLWKQSPFGETQMVNVSGKIFTATLTGQTMGATINYACKFAYAGGLSVTKYVSYVVGSNCGSTNDTQAPTNFTASIGAITGSSVELLLNANDNSGTVVYNVAYGANSSSTSSASGVQKSFLITGLSPNTNYNFSVLASDLVGNVAVNNPIVLNATTSANTNTDCAGTASEASQGTFSVGYKYAFQTIGTDVKITFELLDDKTGVIAYLWKQSPFAETSMTNVSGKIFTKTISGQTVGSTISYAVKFAFAGGLSVTKYLSYTVGNSCSLGVENPYEIKQLAYPNPVENSLQLQLFDDQNQITLTDVLGRKVLEDVVKSTHTIDMSSFKSGIYFLKINNSLGIENLKIIKN